VVLWSSCSVIVAVVEGGAVCCHVGPGWSLERQWVKRKAVVVEARSGHMLTDYKFVRSTKEKCSADLVNEKSVCILFANVHIPPTASSQ
jgi:hypothetical protein